MYLSPAMGLYLDRCCQWHRIGKKKKKNPSNKILCVHFTPSTHRDQPHNPPLYTCLERFVSSYTSKRKNPHAASGRLTRRPKQLCERGMNFPFSCWPKLPLRCWTVIIGNVGRMPLITNPSTPLYSRFRRISSTLGGDVHLPKTKRKIPWMVIWIMYLDSLFAVCVCVCVGGGGVCGGDFTHRDILISHLLCRPWGLASRGSNPSSKGKCSEWFSVNYCVFKTFQLAFIWSFTVHTSVI